MIKTLFVAGPTAAGKTEYAIRLAQELGGEIVSADSMQIYRYMDIGSAKPTAEERAAARHHMIDCVDPRTPFNVSDYQKQAMVCIRDIAGRGRLPIVCGGTGLYLNSLLYDMDFSAAEGSDDNRRRIFTSFGGDPEKLHRYLTELDPEAAAEIHPNNIKRMIRAIERLELGEVKLASFSRITKKSTELDPVLTVLSRERGELYDRIDRRVDKLIAAGLGEEVLNLMARGFTADDIAMKGIGYKEIITAVYAGCKPEDAAETIKLNTRHLAKRQLTWFRRYEAAAWFEPKGDAFDEETFTAMLTYVKELL